MRPRWARAMALLWAVALAWTAFPVDRGTAVPASRRYRFDAAQVRPAPPPDHNCTLVSHLCATGRAGPSNQFFALLKLAHLARGVLRCRVAPAKLCWAPEWTEARLPADLFFATGNLRTLDGAPLWLSGQEKRELGLSAGQRPLIPCLLDEESDEREPQASYDSLEFRCDRNRSLVLGNGVSGADVAALGPLVGLPFPFRIPVSLGGRGGVPDRGVRNLVRAKGYVVDLARGLLERALARAGRSWANASLLAAFPEFATVHVRSNAEFTKRCVGNHRAFLDIKAGRTPPAGSTPADHAAHGGCGADVASIPAFLARSLPDSTKAVIVSTDLPSANATSLLDGLRASLAPRGIGTALLDFLRTDYHPDLTASRPANAPDFWTAGDQAKLAGLLAEQLILGCGNPSYGSVSSTFLDWAKGFAQGTRGWCAGGTSGGNLPAVQYGPDA